ncbi:MAG: hypothetical protein E6H48_09120 [Betaproteobacteria bacterium]|nr:MAG: hypothetical protein E6H71_13585 [Betaproteobacteria bacterium]TMH67249.1 MAG: hypothetical protein E6H48_09120 [Betaproteobacteria bacterium]
MSGPREAKTRSRLRAQGEAKARSARLRARAAADALTFLHPGGCNEAADGSRLAAADNGFFGGRTGARRPPR